MASFDCYLEAHPFVNQTTYLTRFDMFERYLASLLDLLGFSSDSVVRYTNAHRF